MSMAFTWHGVTGKAREHAREMLQMAGGSDPKARSSRRKA